MSNEFGDMTVIEVLRPCSDVRELIVGDIQNQTIYYDEMPFTFETIFSFEPVDCGPVNSNLS